jgi:thiamine kinase-like enzyme
MTPNYIVQLIASTGFCSCEEIDNLAVMKAGMTNNSYSFCAAGKKYIIRIPGEGTEQLINRHAEYDVYKAIDILDISENVKFFDPETGIKISTFMENASSCSSENFDEVELCMQQLRRFHNEHLQVYHTFDLWERIEYYESLLEGRPSYYDDYVETKAAVAELFAFVEQQPREYTLCHIDSVPDNFLFEETGEGRMVRLIDWEYAGMQDPHLDIAMFAVYAMYDRQKVDRLIDAYFVEGCPRMVRLKVYCYVAISGLLWSNWCEFKRMKGVEFGDYALKQYEYAREYSAYFRSEMQKMKEKEN